MSEFFENADSIDLKLLLLGSPRKRKSPSDDDDTDLFEEFLLNAAELVGISFVTTSTSVMFDSNRTISSSSSSLLTDNETHLPPLAAPVDFEDFLNSYDRLSSSSFSHVSFGAVEDISSDFASVSLLDPKEYITETHPGFVLQTSSATLSLTNGVLGENGVVEENELSNCIKPHRQNITLLNSLR